MTNRHYFQSSVDTLIILVMQVQEQFHQRFDICSKLTRPAMLASQTLVHDGCFAQHGMDGSGNVAS
ncbi:hypothetical protein [Azohydromonas lata]|uniref:Uncharacterized protein n=1 Tax=Azohydromonas lata TaxID=45677 RepID=A0ABU5IDB2_9BURK|nr:hypothetical protein [Azohydromonas lata]MDZ5457109.1 hypothetical protein [Azohydromonas lata]